MALPDGALRDRLLALLAGRDVVLEERTPPQALGPTRGGPASDLVIVRREDLPADHPQRLEALAVSEEAPDVLVVGPGLRPAEVVDLVAAGARGVLDPTRLDARAADVIEDMAARGAGHAEPDGPGATPPSLSDFTSRSKAMRTLMDLVARVAPADCPLLITGETGVGKEHLARAIHAASPRHAGPFVAVNCAALPAELLESELFGHVAGAFTGAKGARKGTFRSAVGGTLLLDEIGELPLGLQVKLLRVLQRKEVRPVGADEEVALDVRVCAATHRDLREAVAEGTFREDLYYRLHVVELVVPPLRERPEDLPTLVGALLRHVSVRHAAAPATRLDEGAVEALLRHTWPGNVRELLHALERAVLLSPGPVIGVEHLPPDVRDRAPPSGRTGPSAGLPAALRALPWSEARQRGLRDLERAYLHEVLTACEGAVGVAAERAGLSRRSLYEKMKRHGLRKESYRP